MIKLHTSNRAAIAKLFPAAFNSAEEADIAARNHIETVRALQKAARARLVASAPQTYDTSTLPLFGDGHLQQSLF